MPKDFLNKAGYPIGLRNNNPGNIRPGDNWRGMIGTNGGFVQFENCAWGLRAMGIDLLTKMRNGYDTVREIITRWAPPSENDTAGYISKVCQYTGWTADKLLQPTVDNLRLLMMAIINVELGANYASLLTVGDVNEGISMIDSGITTAQAVGGFTIASALLITAIVLLATMPKNYHSPKPGQYSR